MAVQGPLALLVRPETMAPLVVMAPRVRRVRKVPPETMAQPALLARKVLPGKM